MFNLLMLVIILFICFMLMSFTTKMAFDDCSDSGEKLVFLGISLVMLVMALGTADAIVQLVGM